MSTVPRRRPVGWSWLRVVLVFCAGLAALILGIIALTMQPDNEADLLAGAAIAAGAGLMAAAFPAVVP